VRPPRKTFPAYALRPAGKRNQPICAHGLALPASAATAKPSGVRFFTELRHCDEVLPYQHWAIVRPTFGAKIASVLILLANRAARSERHCHREVSRATHPDFAIISKRVTGKRSIDHSGADFGESTSTLDTIVLLIFDPGGFS
jgi:hypothetical protein